MHAWLALALLWQPQGSLLGEICPRPTGANGYEQYLMAADIVSLPKVAELGSTVRTTAPGGEVLAARRGWAQGAKKAMELIAAGNRKPVWDPRKSIDDTTAFPEYSAFRNVARLVAATVYVDFAEASSAQATQDLIEGLEFSERIGHGVVIASLVGGSCTGMILAEAARDIGYLSQRDSLALGREANRLVQLPPSLIDALDGERRMVLAGLPKLLADKDAVEKLIAAGKDPTLAQILRWQQEFNALNPAGRQEALDRMAAGIGARFDRLQKTLARPESEWVRDKEPESQHLTLESAVVDALSPWGLQLGTGAARVRTQLRLLRLHCAVTAFRWEHDQLPKSLDELPDPTWADDPLSGGKFRYTRLTDTAYDLWSDGAGSTGRIDLKYVAPARDEQGPTRP